MHLVEQHAKEEFHVLQGSFRVTAISGDSSHKCFFGQAVKRSDVVICTAQILHNALLSREEDTRVELTGGHGTPPMAGTPPWLGYLPLAGTSLWLGPPPSTSCAAHPALLPRPGADFSLLVIDECHHTQKEAVYNKIMLHYLQRKLSGRRDLPQILGLTASPGTGGKTSFEGAVEHVLQVGAAPPARGSVGCTVVVLGASEHPAPCWAAGAQGWVLGLSPFRFVLTWTPR